MTKMDRILSGEGGSVLVMAALSLVFMMVILGFAVDVGRLRQVKCNVQNAADAAALAAAIEVRNCGNTSNCASMQSAVQDAMAENGMTATAMLSNCSGTAGSGVTVTVNNPPCAIASDPNRGMTNYAEAIVTEQVTMMFARFAGMQTVTVSARSEAGRGLGGPCVYALDSSGAAIVVIGGTVQASCGVVDESTSSNALSCVLGATIYAPRISVSGGSDSLPCLATSKPRTNMPPPTPRDPLAYLPAPPTANDPCGTSTHSPYSGSSSAVNLLLPGSVIFNPGVYCGGISATASLLSTITFNSGTYILRDGPGLLGITQGGLQLTLTLLSSVTGSGVTFYNQGPTGNFSVVEPISGGSIISLSNINLTAPTSGTYGGVLFFQAHGVTSAGTILANLMAPSNMQGATYLPDAAVTYSVSSVSATYSILVAKDIYLTLPLSTSFANDYSTLQGGSPLTGDNVRLVE
jgi:Flp pilus assembly protein TadG